MTTHAQAEFFVETAVRTNRTNARQWVFSYVRHNIWILIFMLIGAIGNATLAAVVPIQIGLGFDAVLQEVPDISAVGWAAIVVIISQTVRATLQLGRNFCSELLGQRIERDAREELYVDLGEPKYPERY